MKACRGLFIALPLVAGTPLQARPSGAVRPVVAGPVWRGAQVRAAATSGIAGGDIARPALRGTVGGGTAIGGGINGTRLRQKH